MGGEGIVRHDVSTGQNHKDENGKFYVKKLLKRKLTMACSKKLLHKRFPLINWMKTYSLNAFINDLLAGLTVGLTAIPQGIAYAVVAGLEPQYGLYSGFMGCFVYFFLGTVKDITIGPTAIMALMTQKSVEAYNSDFAVLLCFLTGCIIMLLGILHLGFLVCFISVPVIVGFTTAAAITIASSQVKGLLGIKGKSHGFLDTWISVFQHITETRFEDLGLGLFTIFFLVALKASYERFKRRNNELGHLKSPSKALKETFRIISLGRNAIVVIIGTIAAYIFDIYGMTPFTLTGKVDGGLPVFQPPPFSTTLVKNNETVVLNFQDMVSEIGTGLISVPMISILETIAIAKSFSKGQILDATQEMIALGASNLLGCFVRSMPTAGSFTRTAVNNASNVHTPLGGLFTGALVLSALALTATFKYIPKASLAGLIMTAMFYMLEVHEIMLIWKTKKSDLFPFTVTVLGCLLFGLDMGIIVGIGVNLLYILYPAARPQFTKEENLVAGQEILVIRPEEAISYPGAEYIRELIMKAILTRPSRNFVAIDGRNLNSIDMTVAKNIKTLVEDLEKLDQDLILWNWKKTAMEICIKLDQNLMKNFKNSDTIQDLLIGLG